MTTYQMGFKKYHWSKFKVLLLLREFRSFYFDWLYFWSPFWYKVIQYLIGKLLDIVKMIQEGKVVAAPSTSIRISWKAGIYFINGTLIIFNLAPLYVEREWPVTSIVFSLLPGPYFRQKESLYLTYVSIVSIFYSQTVHILSPYCENAMRHYLCISNSMEWYHLFFVVGTIHKRYPILEIISYQPIYAHLYFF